MRIDGLVQRLAIDTSDPIDRAAIERLRRDYNDRHGDFVAALVEAFADEIRELQWYSLRPPVAEQPRPQLDRSLQRVKCAAMTLGANRVAAGCEQLLRAIRCGDREGAARLTADLNAALVRARVELQRIAGR